MTWTEFTTHDEAPSSPAVVPAAGRRFSCCMGGRAGLRLPARSRRRARARERRRLVPAARARAVCCEGPYTVATDVDDARRVLNALGWDQAWVVGHSWVGTSPCSRGGFAGATVRGARRRPARVGGRRALAGVRRGDLPSDPRGRARAGARARRTDDGGRRRRRAGARTMRLVWPAYFADPEQAPPMPELRIASERSAQMVPSIFAELPVLEAGLPRIRVPVGFVHGSRARCLSQLRRTRPTGFPARGSTSSTARAISCGSRPQARFETRFGASPPEINLQAPAADEKIHGSVAVSLATSSACCSSTKA